VQPQRRRATTVKEDHKQDGAMIVSPLDARWRQKPQKHDSKRRQHGKRKDDDAAVRHSTKTELQEQNSKRRQHEDKN
jgi:hypothetical protein